MGDLMTGIPSVPGVNTTWTAFVDQFETLKRGDMPLSLTNWDNTTTKPAIAAGAALEIAGATYRFTAESAISDESGLIAGTVYVIIKTADPTASEATAYFTNTAPIWRDDLHGWYDATGVFRYTGHQMAWDGTSLYTEKAKIIGNAKEQFNALDGPNGASLNVSNPSNWKGLSGVKALGSTENWIIPAGMYMFASFYSAYLYIQDDGGTWRIGSTHTNLGYNGGVIISDGVNYRFSGGGLATTIYYRKIW